MIKENLKILKFEDTFWGPILSFLFFLFTVVPARQGNRSGKKSEAEKGKKKEEGKKSKGLRVVK